MNQLKIAQTKLTFTVYPNNTQKKFTQYNDLSTSSEQVYSPDFSLVEQTKFSNTTLNNSVTPLLASEDILSSDNLIFHHRLKVIKQVRKFMEKYKALLKKYTEEKKEETGKGTSKWPYFYLMSEIFGNRENVYPESLIDSTGKV
ncbi:17243_t:CDS:2, partial [Gigaspora rosea]